MKYIKILFIAVALMFLFNGCNGSDGLIENNDTVQVVSSSGSNDIKETEYSNIYKSSSDDSNNSTTIDEVLSTIGTTINSDAFSGNSNTGDSTGATAVTTVSTTAIPFPTMPSNITLDNKYIPPQ